MMIPGPKRKLLLLHTAFQAHDVVLFQLELLLNTVFQVRDSICQSELLLLHAVFHMHDDVFSQKTMTRCA